MTNQEITMQDRSTRTTLIYHRRRKLEAVLAQAVSGAVAGLVVELVKHLFGI